MPPKKTKAAAAAPTPTRAERGRAAPPPATEEPPAKNGNIIKASKEKLDAPSKRRGRPPVNALAEAEAAQQLTKELANATGNESPKKRGRDATKIEETAAEKIITEASKRRGRPSKASTDVIADEKPDAAKKTVRGTAVAGAEEESAETTEAPPKRRGRPAANNRAAPAEIEGPTEAPPKRRGRPAAVTKVMPAEAPIDTAPKRRGRPAATKPNAQPKVTEDAPKRRGRPAAAKVEELGAADEPSSTRRKGRGPAKAKQAEPEQQTEATASRRGRPPKAESAAKPVSTKAPKPVAGKKRGRPPAEDAEVIPPTKKARGKAVIKPSSAAPAGGKPRGRPKGATNKPKTDASKVLKAPSTKKADKAAATPATATAIDADGNRYWLMKAEPESRIDEKTGRDVKFSIDDLIAAEKHEPWDGVRNHAAKNNMMAMKQGDLAFFYHSNCKVPGIAGVIEIAQEATIDESAFDDKHPYFDPKSSRENPKWFNVHVAPKQKFRELITLKTLQSHAAAGGPLESMELVKQGRLSVQKVKKSEWDFIMGLAGQEAPTAGTTSIEEAAEEDEQMEDADAESGADKRINTEIEAAMDAELNDADVEGDHVPIDEPQSEPMSLFDRITKPIVSAANAMTGGSISTSIEVTTPPDQIEPEEPSSSIANGDSILLNGKLRAQSVQPPNGFASMHPAEASSRPASRGFSVPPTASTKRSSRPASRTGSRAGSRAPSVGPRSRRSVSRGLSGMATVAPTMSYTEMNTMEVEMNGQGMEAVVEEVVGAIEREGFDDRMDVLDFDVDY
ncbi:DUF55-domain-containing protein [Lepidopterella palustris CBS 459.81]|uniref:Thymocyte nuclear protein 1 n=1 Tax=Lepidopterella palustris CBS 459.81 TaxID=1314670 RepID=A0A8E2EJJ6_9PEZI|nr:DUF55-domain-containing protein [Lepidopterella palustris CBS 459.81]